MDNWVTNRRFLFDANRWLFTGICPGILVASLSTRPSFPGPVTAVELRDAVCCIYWNRAKLQMFLFSVGVTRGRRKASLSDATQEFKMLEIRREPLFVFAQSVCPLNTLGLWWIWGIRALQCHPPDPCPDATGLFPKINSPCVFIYFFFSKDSVLSSWPLACRRGTG